MNKLLLCVVGVILASVSRADAQDGIACSGEPTNMSITYGDVVQCVLTNSLDTDDFTFAGIIGETIVVHAGDSCVTLTAPSGATFDACGGRHPRLDATLSETGTFRITARTPGFGTFPASYGVALERVTPLSPRAQPIRFGETRTDQFNVEGDIDVFTFNGAAGSNVRVVVNETTPSTFFPCVEIIAPDATRVEGCALVNPNQASLLVPVSGTHVLIVRQSPSRADVGPYTVQLFCVSGGCEPAPGAPTGLTGSLSSVATSLSWTAPTGGGAPTSYVVEAGTAAGSTNVIAFDTLSVGTTFLAPGVPNGTYYYRVKARNAGGTSAASNEITLTGTAGGCAPSPPGNLTANVTGFNVSLQWSASTGNPTTYVLEAGTATGLSNIASVDLGLTTQFSTAAPAGTYFVRARARNACGLSSPSNEVTFAVGQACTSAPSAPATFTTSLSGLTLTLTWSAASGNPATYFVEAGTATGLSNLANQEVGNQLSLTTNVPPGRYFIRIRARNACGTSPASIERVVNAGV